MCVPTKLEMIHEFFVHSLGATTCRSASALAAHVHLRLGLFGARTSDAAVAVTIVRIFYIREYSRSCKSVIFTFVSALLTYQYAGKKAATTLKPWPSVCRYDIAIAATPRWLVSTSA